MAGFADRGRELLVAAVRPGAEIHVEGDDGGAGLMEVAHRRGMVRARPRPAAQLGEALGVDLDDDGLARGLLRQQLGSAVGERVLDGTEQAGERKQGRRNRNQQCRDEVERPSAPVTMRRHNARTLRPKQ